MSKMATMPIYSKRPSKIKIIFYGTGGLVSMKLSMKHRVLEVLQGVFIINHSFVMTLTYFMADK